MTPLRKITDEHAIKAAAIAGISALGATVERSKNTGEVGSILVTNKAQNRSCRIYFDGADTIVEQSGFRVRNYCYDIYAYLKSLGYSWK